MRYLPLFRLRVLHGYYVSGPCTAIRVEPSVDGARLLKNLRMVWKPLPDGLVVFAPTDEKDRLFIPVPQHRCLEFHLFRNNADFDLVTEWEDQGTPIYRNDPEGLTRRELVPDNEPGTIKSIRGVLAHVRIFSIDSEWLSEDPEDFVKFSIQFQPKQARWVYYLVLDKLNGAYEPSIEDDAKEGTLSFETDDLSGIGSIPVSADSVANWLSIQYPDHRRFRIFSQEVIPCNEVPKRSLKLKLGEEEQVVVPLANPSPRNFSTCELVVNDARKIQNTLYEVLRYQLHAFQS